MLKWKFRDTLLTNFSMTLGNWIGGVGGGEKDSTEEGGMGEVGWLRGEEKDGTEDEYHADGQTSEYSATQCIDTVRLSFAIMHVWHTCITAVRLHVYLDFVKSIEQELKIQ